MGTVSAVPLRPSTHPERLLTRAVRLNPRGPQRRYCTATPQWRELKDKNSGRLYYANPVTGGSQWHAPDEPYVRFEEEVKKPRREAPRGTRRAGAKVWVKILDKGSNMYYWGNQLTGQTQWTEPEDSDAVQQEAGAEHGFVHRGVSFLGAPVVDFCSAEQDVFTKAVAEKQPLSLPELDVMAQPVHVLLSIPDSMWSWNTFLVHSAKVDPKAGGTIRSLHVWFFDSREEAKGFVAGQVPEKSGQSRSVKHTAPSVFHRPADSEPKLIGLKILSTNGKGLQLGGMLLGIKSRSSSVSRLKEKAQPKEAEERLTVDWKPVPKMSVAQGGLRTLLRRKRPDAPERAEDTGGDGLRDRQLAAERELKQLAEEELQKKKTRMGETQKVTSESVVEQITQSFRQRMLEVLAVFVARRTALFNHFEQETPDVKDENRTFSRAEIAEAYVAVNAAEKAKKMSWRPVNLGDSVRLRKGTLSTTDSPEDLWVGRKVKVWYRVGDAVRCWDEGSAFCDTAVTRMGPQGEPLCPEQQGEPPREWDNITPLTPMMACPGDEEHQQLEPGQLATVVTVLNSAATLGVADRPAVSVRLEDGTVVAVPQGRVFPVPWTVTAADEVTVTDINVDGSLFRLSKADGELSPFISIATFKHLDGSGCEPGTALLSMEDTLCMLPIRYLRAFVDTLITMAVPSKAGRNIFVAQEDDAFKLKLPDGIEEVAELGAAELADGTGTDDESAESRTGLAALACVLNDVPEALQEVVFKAISGDLRFWCENKKASKMVAEFVEWYSLEIRPPGDDEDLPKEAEAKPALKRAAQATACITTLLTDHSLRLTRQGLGGLPADHISASHLEKLCEAIIARRMRSDRIVGYQEVLGFFAEELQLWVELRQDSGSSTHKFGKRGRSVADMLLDRPEIVQAAGELLETLLTTELPDGGSPFSRAVVRVGKVSSSGDRVYRSKTVVKVASECFSTEVADPGSKTTLRTQQKFPVMLTAPDSWGAAKRVRLRDGRSKFVTTPYLESPAEFIRSARGQTHLAKAMANMVSPALGAGALIGSLDYLSGVPWRLHGPTVNLLTNLRLKGEEIGDKLSRGWVPVLPKTPQSQTRKSEFAFRSRTLRVKQTIVQQEGKSTGGAALMPLMHKHLNDRFYLPVNMDFRGRIYPLHGLLNYQGSDFVRGALMFGDRKPLGATGLNALKVHLANLMGHDKQPLNDRAPWSDNNQSAIARAIENPMAPDALWRSADKPFAAYSAMYELYSAWTYSQGAENYETNVPVHVDGSCNGLQHYSAMARDARGAATANLEPRSKDEPPSDVYTTVLKEVIKLNDAIRADIRHPLCGTARSCIPVLKRKTIKQCVMTNIYGVTSYGMKLQIAKQLEDLQPEASQSEVLQQASYLGRLVSEAIEDVFSGAVQIQKWMKTCVKMIMVAARRTGVDIPVTFTSPIGLPVAQPYAKRAVNDYNITRKVGSLKFSVPKKRKEEFLQTTDARKQESAFPPNFIHSMDASHVVFTARRMQEHGFPVMAGVHDSYWTHAADLDGLNEHLREAFVELYKPNRLEMLFLDLQTSYGRMLKACAQTRLPEPPALGEFDISRVRDAPYFFA